MDETTDRILTTIGWNFEQWKAAGFAGRTEIIQAIKGPWKACTACKMPKKLDAFGSDGKLNKDGSLRIKTVCRKCDAKRQRERKRTDVGRSQEKDRKRRYKKLILQMARAYRESQGDSRKRVRGTLARESGGLSHESQGDSRTRVRGTLARESGGLSQEPKPSNQNKGNWPIGGVS